MYEGKPETIHDQEGGEQSDLEIVEQELSSFLPESDLTLVDLSLPSEEELVEFPTEWAGVSPEERTKIDVLIEADVAQVLRNEEGVVELIDEEQLEAVITEEAEGIDEEAADVLSNLSGTKRPAAEGKVRQFKRSKVAASLFALLGVVGVAENVQAGSRDINFGRAIEQIILKPEIRSQRQENSAEQRYENNIRSLQLRYNQQAGKIQGELNQLNDPNFIQLRERQADIKIEIQYNKPISMATSPAEKERLTTEREARKAEARVAQQLKDEQRKITLEQALDTLDAKYEQSVQEAQMKYTSERQKIQGQKEEKRAQEIGKIIERVFR